MNGRGVLLISAVLVCSAGGQAAAAEPGRKVVLPREFVDAVLASDNPVALARAFGMTTLMGRPLDPGPGAVRRALRTRFRSSRWHRWHRRPPKLGDVAITDDPLLTQNAPNIVSHPRYKSVLVTAYVGFPFPEAQETQCIVKRSFDGGRTWSDGVFLPLRPTAVSCGGPVLAYSPDGRRLYAAYQDFRAERTDPEELPEGGSRYRSEGDADIAVSVSTDHGRTWSASSAALDGEPWGFTVTCGADGTCTTSDEVGGSNYSRASIGIVKGRHRRDEIYVTGTRGAQVDETAPRFAIAFTRSAHRRWTPPTVVDFTTRPATEEIVQGGQVAVTPTGQILVAWYHSSDDGPRVGRFEIRTRHSVDRGRSWGPIVKAAIDEDETNFWLGSNPRLKTWWTNVFPRLAIDRGGGAHIVYTHDPEPGSDTGEEGDIRYITSKGAPYGEWSVPETVNDDGFGSTQGRPSLAVRHQGRRSIVDVIWEDTRLSSETPDGPQASNLYYDIFHSWLRPGRGAGWAPNRRVSDESSLQSSQFIESGTSLATNGARLYGVWVDRRDKTSLTELGENIYGSRILAGRATHR